MNFTLSQELKGFLATPALWTSQPFYDLWQFEIPEVSLAKNLDLENEMPNLQHNIIMGKRMERFFSFILNNSPKYNIVGENIQIIENKVTLGELDFLIEEEKQKQHYHVELVYKFYLYDPSFKNEFERWIGPNRKDSLLQKIDKLKANQLPLLYSTEVKKVLDKLKIDPSFIKQKVCFKASLFIPIEYKNCIFPGINNKCITGFYIPYSEFIKPTYDPWQFYAPGKQEWPIDPKYNNDWYSHDEIVMQIKELFKKNRSPLLWIKKNDFVYERLFVVWW